MTYAQPCRANEIALHLVHFGSTSLDMLKPGGGWIDFPTRVGDRGFGGATCYARFVHHERLRDSALRRRSNRPAGAVLPPRPMEVTRMTLQRKPRLPAAKRK